MQHRLGEHIEHLQQRWEQALDRHGYDGAWLTAGEAGFDFQDDQGPRFKANAYLRQWVDPRFLGPGARLFVRPGRKPVLFLHRAVDYWHATPELPESLTPHVDVRGFADMPGLLDACQQESQPAQRLAHIGPPPSDNETLGDSNPAPLVDYLHFHRATKTAYELAAMREASVLGARGHLAAEQAFIAGGTEFDIHMAFLQASQQSEVELPYGNIVALNEHAATLHYQHQERAHRQPPRSLLIDAGGQYRGYASDITRTYAAAGEAHALFAELLEHMQGHQLALLDAIEPGMTFAELHIRMHRGLADVLVNAGLVTCSADAAFSSGITEMFCPHGLGHLLGLQVHDVGGHLADDAGRQAPPPDNYPALRFTRAIGVDHVFTIEPGLYFIDSLLADLRARSADVDWARVDALRPYGGIRIEDNVRVLDAGHENLTRDAFARVADER